MVLTKDPDVKVARYRTSDGFYVYVIEDREKFEALLGHPVYGVATYMFMMQKIQPLKPDVTEEKFLETVMTYLEEYEQQYEDEVFDCQVTRTLQTTWDGLHVFDLVAEKKEPLHLNDDELHD